VQIHNNIYVYIYLIKFRKCTRCRRAKCFWETSWYLLCSCRFSAKTWSIDFLPISGHIDFFFWVGNASMPLQGLYLCVFCTFLHSAPLPRLFPFYPLDVGRTPLKRQHGAVHTWSEAEKTPLSSSKLFAKGAKHFAWWRAAGPTPLWTGVRGLSMSQPWLHSEMEIQWFSLTMLTMRVALIRLQILQNHWHSLKPSCLLSVMVALLESLWPQNCRGHMDGSWFRDEWPKAALKTLGLQTRNRPWRCWVGHC